MQGNTDRANWMRRVADLLEKTVENSATPEEEKSAVQLAFLLTRQHGLDMDLFRLALGRIGNPPRYMITSDGFLVPAKGWRGGAPWDGVDRRRRAWDGAERRRRREAAAASEAAHAAGGGATECPASPSGQHRMQPVMQGTFRTGYESCIHCGTRRQQQ